MNFENLFIVHLLLFLLKRHKTRVYLELCKHVNLLSFPCVSLNICDILPLIFKVFFYRGSRHSMRAEKTKSLLFDMRNRIIVSWNSL